MILGLALSPSLDVTYEVETLRLGDITRPRAVTLVAGGKTLNVARVASAVGADVAVVAALGGHVGAFVAQMLRDEGIATRVTRLARETRTSIAIVPDDAGASSTDLYEAATPLDASEWRQFVAAAKDAAEHASTAALSGSLPAGVEPGDLADLLEQLRAGGVRIVVDSSGAGLRAAIAHADLVKINRSEAAGFLGGDRSPRAAARALAKVTGGDVVVTDGVRGAAGLLSGVEVTSPPPLRTGRFSAGSGDAFLGGLLAVLDGGGPPDEALRVAADAAERNAIVPGQGILGPVRR